MNTTKLEKLENATRKTFGQKILSNIALIDNESLPLIREALWDEEIKRGLPSTGIIKIAVEFYKAEIAEGKQQEDVLNFVVDFVKKETNYSIAIDDILNNLGDLPIISNQLNHQLNR